MVVGTIDLRQVSVKGVMRHGLVAAALAGAFVAAGGEATASPATQSAVAVAANDDFFAPQTVSIPVGSTVTWTNRGGNPHTVTAEHGDWDSGTMGPGSTYSMTFRTPGSYPYHCRFHRGTGMIGTVNVTAGTPAPAAPPTASPSAYGYKAPPPAYDYKAPPPARGYQAPPPLHAPPGYEAPPGLYPPPMPMYGSDFHGNFYIVRRGDTILRIARLFGVAPLGIIRANGIANPNLIHAGQRLIIPGRHVPPPVVHPPSACRAHVVRYGENTFRIALRYGTTVQAIAAVNRINPNVIFAGQTLLVCPPY